LVKIEIKVPRGNMHADDSGGNKGDKIRPFTMKKGRLLLGGKNFLGSREEAGRELGRSILGRDLIIFSFK